jgi:hypothetical protein
MDQTMRQAFIALGFAGGLTLSAAPRLAELADDDDKESDPADKVAIPDTGNAAIATETQQPIATGDA